MGFNRIVIRTAPPLRCGDRALLRWDGSSERSGSRLLLPSWILRSSSPRVSGCYSARAIAILWNALLPAVAAAVETVADAWAYAAVYCSSPERAAVFLGWLERYDYR